MNAATKIFVALTDDLMYEHPETIDSPLVPYTTDMTCHHWLDIEINPSDLTLLNESNLTEAA